MSIKEKIASAASVDLFDDLSDADRMEAELLADIALQIRSRRIEMNMTQKEFAKFNHVSQATVSKWESAECNFTIASLSRLFAHIGIPLKIRSGKKKTIAATVNQKYVQPAVTTWSTHTISTENWSAQSATLSYELF